MTYVLMGAVSLGLLWAIMTIGVFITYRLLKIADLTVEGSIAMGGAIGALSITSGINPYLAVIFAMFGGMVAGLAKVLDATKDNDTEPESITPPLPTKHQ